MKVRYFNETDDWNKDGSKITSSEKLDVIKATLEGSGPVIVEHWHYRGGRAPGRLVFESFEEFSTWLEEKTFAGDAVDVWSWSGLCKPEKRLVEGKCPDEQGRVPRLGAY